MTMTPSHTETQQEALLAFHSRYPRAQPISSISALMMAARIGGAEGIMWVRRLAVFFNVNHQTNESYSLSALQIAAQQGDAPMIQALLELGADPRAGARGHTPLMAAVSLRQIEAVAALAPVSPIRARSATQATALDIAASLNLKQAVELLLPLYPKNTAPTHFRNAERQARSSGNPALADFIAHSISSRREADEISQATRGASLPSRPRARAL